MTETVISIAAIMTLAVAILATLYRIVRDAPPPQQPQQQSYRRHRPWNFK
jgi:hypothetical protein